MSDSAVYVSLKIHSEELMPDKISEMLGLTCHRSWEKGSARLNTLIKEKRHGWVIESQLDTREPIDVHLRELFRVVGKKTSKIRELGTLADVELACAVYSEEVPALYFDREIIDSISALGASFDVDLYVLAEQEVLGSD